MSALPAQVIEFKLPKRKPKVVEKQAPPDQRKFAVVPMAALTDEKLHHLAIRVLALVCSYANRAGITWVGQQRIADHLGISKQAVNKAIRELKAAGYLEVMSKGFRGERADTLRIIYDPSIKAEDAIAITSAEEDTRPPHQAKKEIKQMVEPEFTEEQMAANRQRLKELLGGLSGRNGTYHYNKPERISDIMARKPTKKSPSIVNPQVDDGKGLHSQPIVNLQVDQTQKTIGIQEVLSLYEEISKKRFSLGLVKSTEIDLKAAEILCEVGVTANELDQALTDAQPLHVICQNILDAKVNR